MSPPRRRTASRTLSVPVTLTAAPATGSARTNGTWSAARWMTPVTPWSSIARSSAARSVTSPATRRSAASSSTDSASARRWSLPPRSYVTTSWPRRAARGRSTRRSRRGRRSRGTSSLIPHSKRRLHAAEAERVREAVERHAQPDERLERLGPALARAGEVLHAGRPVNAVGVHAAEHRAVAEDDVDAEDAAVDPHVARAAVDAEQARDAIAAQQRERIEHELRVARRLDDDVKAADILGERPERGVARRDVPRAARRDE